MNREIPSNASFFGIRPTRRWDDALFGFSGWTTDRWFEESFEMPEVPVFKRFFLSFSLPLPFSPTTPEGNSTIDSTKKKRERENKEADY